MYADNIEKEYFDWICGVVQANNNYQKLLWHLFKNIRFEAILSRDENRADDGINLRYRFSQEGRYSYSEICYALDNRDCSMLEMIAALALKCEENYMYDFTIGDRTSQWFWEMLKNLGLDSFDDYHWSEDYVNEICEVFINRDYAPDGKGSLFYIPGCEKDMREVEIWYQMCWYLNEMYLN